MPDLTHIILFLTASAVLAITPGPDIIYVLTRGIAQGRKAALVAAFGFNLGVIAHTLFAVFGLSAILRTSAIAYACIKYAGAAYLIYIGIQLFRARKEQSNTADTSASSLQTIFRQTIIANILNPKVALFFLAFLPQFVDPARGNAKWQMAIFGILFMLTGFTVFCVVALFSGAIGDRLRGTPRIERRMKALAGGVLVSLGLSLALPEA